MTLWLFTLTYIRGYGKPDGIHIEEHIVAETLEQALEYWHREFNDAGVHIESFRRQVPVIAILPNDKR